MRYPFLIFIFLFFRGAPVNAQKAGGHTKDSLYNALHASKEDTSKAELLYYIGKHYSAVNPDSAIYYLQECEALSKRIDYPVGVAHALLAMAPVYGMQNRLDDCIAVCSEALVISRKIDNKTCIASALFYTADAYKEKGMFETSLDYYLQADTVMQNDGDFERLAYIYEQISTVSRDCGQPETGYKYGLRAMRLADSLHLENLTAAAWASTAKSLSALYRYDTALVLLTHSLEISTRDSDVQEEANALLAINDVYKKTAQYDLILSNAAQALQLASNENIAYIISAALNDEAFYYFCKRDFQKALTLSLRGLEIADSLNDAPLVVNSCNLLSGISIGLGKMDDYFQYRNRADSLERHLVSEQVINHTQELETKYRVTQKEREIGLQKRELHQRLMLNGVLAGTLLLTALAVILGLRSYKNRQRLLMSEKALQQQQIDKLETERQLLASQSVVQGQEEERSRLAKDLHDGLGGILSGAKYSLNNMKENLIVTPENALAYERTMSMLDLSINEMRRIAHNMMPESLMKLSLNEALEDYCLQVSDSRAISINYQSFGMESSPVSNAEKITVYRVVQELINNVLKHAAASHIIVQVIAKENVLSVTVEDDGKGFDTALFQHTSGMGYRNIKSRIESLGGKMDIQSATGKGTSVDFQIPLS